MQAQDVMTQYVVSVGPDDTIARAVHAMLQNDISGLPVLDANGTLVGMITEGDLLRRAETGTERKRPRWVEYFVGFGRLAEEYVDTHGRKVSEIMTAEPATVTEETPLDEVVTLMEKRHIKRVPVVRGGKVVGIASRANLLHALAARRRDHAHHRRRSDHSRAPDGGVGGERWAPAGAIDIIVRNGVVDLWGSITEERPRAALIVAAENTPGVKGVKDHLAWIDPMSGMYSSRRRMWRTAEGKLTADR